MADTNVGLKRPTYLHGEDGMMRALICLLVLMIGLCGCGGSGGKPQGVSLATQYQNAVKDPIPETRARKLVTLAEKQQKAGDNPGATASLDGAVKAAKNIEDSEPRAKVMTLVASALGQSKRGSEAESLLNDVQKTVDKIEDPMAKLEIKIKSAEVKGQYLNEADVAQTQLKEAEKTADSLEDPKAKAMAAIQITSAYHSIKSTSDAERMLAVATELTKSCPDARKQSDCYIELADALIKMGSQEQADAALADAREKAHKIEDPIGRGYSLKNLADKMHRLGKKEDAKALFHDAEKAAAKIADSTMRNQLMGELDKLRPRFE